MGRYKYKHDCKSCGVELTKENRAGRNARCKDCQKEYMSKYNREYYLNRENILFY